LAEWTPIPCHLENIAGFAVDFGWFLWSDFVVQQGLASIIESAVPQTHLIQYGILACFVSGAEITVLPKLES
jgi:hypothetical protein